MPDMQDSKKVKLHRHDQRLRLFGVAELLFAQRRDIGAVCQLDAGNLNHQRSNTTGLLTQ